MESLYIIAALVIGVLLFRSRRQRSLFPLPPGPKGHPFVGSLFTRPVERLVETYTQWGRQYGELVHYDILGQAIVIVNSERAATELLEKRSAIYSDRPSQSSYLL